MKIGGREECLCLDWEEKQIKELMITISRKLELEIYFVRDILDELLKKGYISGKERGKYG